MAKYDIVRINKMSCGNTRGLLDMTIRFDLLLLQEILLLRGDVQKESKIEEKGICTETGKYDYKRENAIYDFKLANVKSPLSKEDDTENLIIDETQQIDFLTVSEDRSAIQLTPEQWLLSVSNNKDLIQSYNEKIIGFRVIYEFERNSINNAKTVLIENSTGIELNALNDLLDVCVKSLFKKSANNYNIPGNLIFSGVDNKANSNIDIYLEFNSYPIDFCLCNNGAFVLSLPTTLLPYMLLSDLDELQQLSISHKFRLEQNPILTILYKGVHEYSTSATTYAEALSSQASSYGSLLCAMQVFEPYTKIVGIDYNYIVGIDQMDDGDRLLSNLTIYGNGDIYGSMTLAKNMYDSSYSMCMLSSGMLLNCRQYCGILNVLGKILLKYYDNIDYAFDSTEKNANGETHASKTSNTTSYRYPYLKVEFFLPNKMAQKTRHKSNLFSIKISDTGLDDDSVVDSKLVSQHVADLVKRDIFNGIKALADSIAPANTLLFKTYYLPSQQ